MHGLQLPEPSIIELAHLVDLEADKCILRGQLVELLEQLMRLVVVDQVELVARICKPLILQLPLLLLLYDLLDRCLYLGVG